MTNTISRDEINALLDRYDSIGQDSDYWVLDAQLLMRAARVIYRQFEGSFSKTHIEPRDDGGGILKDPWALVDHDLFRIYYLLAGFSLELSLKALIVQKNPAIVKKGRKLDWGCNGLDLVALSKIADVDLSDKSELLKNLNESIVWRGRYPIDKSENAIYPALNEFNISGTPVVKIAKQIEEVYESLRKTHSTRNKSSELRTIEGARPASSG